MLRQRTLSFFFFWAKVIHACLLFLDVNLVFLRPRRHLVLVLSYASSANATRKCLQLAGKAQRQTAKTINMPWCRLNAEHPLLRAPLTFIFSIIAVCCLIFVLRAYLTRVFHVLIFSLDGGVRRARKRLMTCVFFSVS